MHGAHDKLKEIWASLPPLSPSCRAILQQAAVLGACITPETSPGCACRSGKLLDGQTARQAQGSQGIPSSSAAIVCSKICNMLLQSGCNHLECSLLVDAALGSCWMHGLQGEVKVVREYLPRLPPLCSARYTTGRCAQCLPAAPRLVSQAPASPCNRPVRTRQCGAMGTMEGMMAQWLCKVNFTCLSPP